jgi:GTP-binding protein EngB required for normal cell division
MASTVSALPQLDDVRLERLAEIASELGATHLQATISAFGQRIAEGRFYVACLGEFKRGKSTLLNALVGHPVLPMGIVPITTVPTIMQYGAEPVARIRFAREDARTVPLAELDMYVSEAKNPRNTLGVEAVEVLLPSPLLRDGLCLVDTPGLGSVFQENTAATRAFIPQIDVALIVIGADPPLSGDELSLIKTAATHVQHLIVVLNKADRFTAVERQEAMRFADQVLSQELKSPVGPILEVSAAERLAGIGPRRDWDRLMEQLSALAAQSGRLLVRRAYERGIERLAGLCIRELNEAHEALFRPLEESDRRVEALRIQEGHMAHHSLLLGFGMTHTAESLSRDAASRRRDFLSDVLPAARAELADAVRQTTIRFGPAFRRYAFVRAQEIARRRLGPWLTAAEHDAESRYQEMTERFIEEARAFLAQSAELAELNVGDLSDELEPAESIRVPSRLDLRTLALPLPRPATRARWLLDAVGLPGHTRRNITGDATRFLEELLTRGARLVDDDFDWRLDQSAQHLKQAVHALLQNVYAAADRAAARARDVRAEGEAALHRELQRLSALRDEVKALVPATGRPRPPRRSTPDGTSAPAS